MANRKSKVKAPAEKVPVAAKPDDSYDPFAPENLRVSQEYLAKNVAKKSLQVTARQPKKHEFIRVNGDEDYRLDVTLIELKEETKGETYVVVPAYAPQLSDKVRDMSFVATLYLAINRQRDYFIWRVKLPSADGRQNNWHTSAAEAAEAAMEKWIRVSPNMSEGRYDIVVAEVNLSEPEWREEPFSKLLATAFKDRLITSDEHPVIQALLGKV